MTIRPDDVPEAYGTISKHHASIQVVGEKLSIERVTAKAPVLVNEHVLPRAGTRAELKSGDTLVLGKVSFDILFASVPSEAPKGLADGAGMLSTQIQDVPANDGEVASLRRRYMRLEAMLATAQHVLLQEELETALEEMLPEVVGAFGLECGVVADLEPGGQLRGRAFVGLERLEDLSHVSQSILQSALETGKPFLLGDTAGRPNRGSSGSIERLGIRSALCAPLRTGSTMLGVLYLDNRGVKNPQPFNGEDEGYLVRLAALISDALSTVRDRATAQLHALLDRAQMIGRSEPMLKLAEQIRKAVRGIDANPTVPVLILGESGSGKELVARALHAESMRRDKPYVEANAGEFKENPQLAQSELFGTVKGAFPEASDRPGAVGAADGGVLFLDEIGDIPIGVQMLLKRFLSDQSFGSYHRLGEEKLRRSTAVVLMATNRDVATLIERGEFLADFAERLRAANVVKLPSLAEHLEDLADIVRYYLRTFNQQYHKQVGISAEGLEVLASFNWKDRNVRALVGVVRALVAGTEGSGPITLGARRVKATLEQRYEMSAKGSQGSAPVPGCDADRPLWEVELDHCLAVWEASGRVYSKAAAKLEIVEGTLKKKLIEGQYRRFDKDLDRVAVFFSKDRETLEREIRSYQVRLST